MKRLIVLLAAALMLGCARDSRIVHLDDGWEYAIGTPPVKWSTEVRGGAMRDLWMRCPLRSAAAPPALRLVFRAYVDSLEVYVDATKVYAFDDPAARDHITAHAVTLPSGRFLIIHVPHAGRGPIFGGSPVLVTSSVLPFALVDIVVEPLRGDLASILIGIALVVIGVIAVGISRLRRRGDPSALLWFGIFAGLYGARLLSESGLPRILGGSTSTLDYTSAFITYVITVPGWILASRLIGDGWHSTLRWQVVAFAIFAPIGIASDLIQRTPSSLEAVNNALVVIGGITILFNLVVLKKWRDPELRVVLAGATLFMLFALNNNLSALGVLPWGSGDETLGFLVFVGVLGYASMRSFVRGERERVAIDGELATAREIQRSILPAEMPRVSGLHVSARYVPASSVAGDLYDFLPVDDDHVGIIVADVSGHGVPAALIASMVKIAVSSNAMSAHDPAAMLAHLARTLRRDVRRTFVTATYLWFDSKERSVSVANAGHPAPLLLRDGTFTELGQHGTVLGRFGISTYSATTTTLQDGDRIVAFTDGITEARNARGEQFGEERLIEHARNGIDDVIDAVHRWRGRVDEDSDDLTIVVIDYSIT